MQNPDSKADLIGLPALSAAQRSGNFVSPYKGLGVWEWEVTTRPALEAGRGPAEYVWAKPVKRILYPRGRAVKNNKRPPVSVFLLPLPSSPNE